MARVNKHFNFAEMDRAFKQLVFECMDLTGTDKDGSVDPECFLKQNDIPWDDPYPYYKGMIAQWVEEDTVDVKPSEDQFTIPSEAVTPSEMLVEDNRSGTSICSCDILLFMTSPTTVYIYTYKQTHKMLV